MTIINYSRNKHQPEVLYLPLAHGGFIQLQEGSHKYPNHAGYGLKNSKNPVVRNYIENGSIVVILDGDDNLPKVNDGTLRTFAPLASNDAFGLNPQVEYAPITSNPTHITSRIEVPQESQEPKIHLDDLLEIEGELEIPEKPKKPRTRE